MDKGLPSDGLPADDPRVIAARRILADAFDRVRKMGLRMTMECGYANVSVDAIPGQYDDVQFFEYNDTEEST